MNRPNRRRTLRVALVAELPPPDAGMPVQARLLIEGMRAEGIQMIPIHARPPLPGVATWFERVPVVRGLLRTPRYLWSLRRLADADVAHLFACSGGSFWAQTVPAAAFAYLLGVPVLMHYHGGGAERFFRRSPLARRALRLADRLVVPSGFLHQVFRRFGIDSAVVPNPLAIDRFDYRARSFEAPVVLACRNLRRVYDVGTALKAFALLLQDHPRARLLVAGDGPQRASLESQARELGIAACTEFVGRVPNDEMAALMARADLLLNTPLADNLPGSVLEAMAAGVAVVSTDVGGIPWLVQDGASGRLAAAGDAPALAAAIHELLEDPDAARDMTRRARRIAEHHAWPHVAPGWVDLYRRLGARGATPARRPRPRAEVSRAPRPRASR